MNRCRKCNTELVEQARFCNVCGSPQTIAGSQVQVSPPTDQDRSDNTNRCHKCGTELPVEARFCNVCGSEQSSSVSLSAATSSEDHVTLDSESPDTKTLSGSPKPSKSFIPTRNIQPDNKQSTSSKESGNLSIRRKTISHPPVFPSRPTNN